MMLHNRVIYVISIIFALMIVGSVARSLSKSVTPDSNILNKENSRNPELLKALSCRNNKIFQTSKIRGILKTEESLRVCYPKEWETKSSFFEQYSGSLSPNETKIYNSLRNSENHDDLKNKIKEFNQCSDLNSQYRNQVVEYQSYQIRNKKSNSNDCP